MVIALDAAWKTTLLPLLAALPFGSFAALLADRLPRDESVLTGRSRCRSCGRTLTARDLVPVLSWLWLRGRCRCCRQPIGFDPLLAELAALGVAAGAVVVLPPALVWPGCLLGWCLLALALADARHMLLPDALTLPLCAAGLGVALAQGGAALAAAMAGAVLGYAVPAAIGAAYRRLRGHDGIGLGDAKLLAAGGAWLGWAALPSVLLLAALGTLAAALVAALVAGRGRVEPDLAMPFGPGLAGAIWLVFLAGA
jgi:leader peptidase (prepilin peptidase)/N-methyltransferase